MSSRLTRHTPLEPWSTDAPDPTVAVASPFAGQRLAIPRDLRLGDTPEGDPAVLWKIPFKLVDVPLDHGVKDVVLKIPRYAVADWKTGGEAARAIGAFLALAHEDRPARFLYFAKRYGPLGLWAYRRGGATSSATETRIGSLVDATGGDIWVPSITDGILTPLRYSEEPLNREDLLRLEVAGDMDWRYEPISEWRRWAQWFAAVIEIAQLLRTGSLGTQKQWATLGVGRKTFVELDYGRDRERQKRQLAVFVQKYIIAWSGLIPALQWTDDTPRIGLTFGGHGAMKVSRAANRSSWPENVVFPALAGGLLAILDSREPVASCSLCGKLHPRNRRPQAGRATYCEACQPEAAKRWKRESAARRREREKQT